jgi:protein tyrosine phosphatase (PTP) superfamily phosphohydrolase (DUF442 family)
MPIPNEAIVAGCRSSARSIVVWLLPQPEDRMYQAGGSGEKRFTSRENG